MQILRGDNLHELSNSIFSEKIRQKNSKCRQLKFNSASITKTRLYHFDPLRPHFYIVKLGFIGVYIMFLISAKNIDCGYSLEPPPRRFLQVPAIYVLSRNMKKISEFFIENFMFLEVRFSLYLNRRVFIMAC